MRRVAGGVLALLIGVLVTGCAVFDTEDDERRARDLADELYPGRLAVVGARTLFPESGGSEITFSLAGDPDAAVRFRVDAGRDRCDGGASCAQALTKAVDRAERQGAWLRAMRESFDGCGHPVLATDEALNAPWVGARVTDATLDDVLARVGACAQRWVTARADLGLPAVSAVAVDLADPATAKDLPAARSGLPGLLRLTHKPRLAALAGTPYYAVAFPVRDGTVDVGAARLRIVPPFEERQAFSREIDASVLPLLRRTYPDAVTAGAAGLGVWRLEPGTTRRMRGYVLFCARPAPDGKGCFGDLAALVRTDPKGRDAEVLRILTDIRDERGVLRLPPE